MSGKQQKGEAISRAARAETGARAGGKRNWYASINCRVGTSISAKSQRAAATFAAWQQQMPAPCVHRAT